MKPLAPLTRRFYVHVGVGRVGGKAEIILRSSWHAGPGFGKWMTEETRTSRDQGSRAALNTAGLCSKNGVSPLLEESDISSHHLAPLLL